MSLKNTLIAIFLIFIITLILSDGEPKPYAKWGYDEDLGPKKWSQLDQRYKICDEGVNQSPINISNAIEANLPKLQLQGNSKATTFLNNGNTLEVKFSNGNFLSLDEKKFSLKKIDFHTPSENQINGISYPMEAQLIHSDSYGNIAVISIMIEESNEDNIVLNKLLRNLPENIDDKNEIKSNIQGYEIIPTNKDYYTFNGSLTTPPCTEAVRWIVIKESLKASKEQIEDFKAVMPKNNRPIQKINARYILQ